MQDLFEHGASEQAAADMPLAARMRPRTLDEFVGQDHLVAPGAPLRAGLEQDRVWSVILWGPPGSGKTTLARLATTVSGRHAIHLSAVTVGVREVREAVDEAQEQRQLYQRRTLVFLDEIHRFNKAQQDALLPHVETGTIALWGATTENPYFTVIAPLLSRMQVLRLQPLGENDIHTIVERALTNPEHGLGSAPPRFDSQAIQTIVARSGGDARVALNWLEASSAYGAHHGIEEVDAELVSRTMLERQSQYDRKGEEHYDTISAFIKSLRGSDPDAAVLWLAKMLRAGEAPEFIARRLLILASEDIGNADPQALQVAIFTAEAVERLGLPEARFALAQATIYLASAPKSDAAGRSLNSATAAIEAGADIIVPLHLRNETFRDAGDLGYGQDYQNPHDYPGNYVEQDYLPQSLYGTRFYDGRGAGQESKFHGNVERLRNKRGSEHSEDVPGTRLPPQDTTRAPEN